MNDSDSILAEPSEEQTLTTSDSSIIEDRTLLYQTPAYLLQLVHQAEHVEKRLSTLLGEVKQNNHHLDMLVRHATEATSTRLIEQRLADLVVQLEEHQEQLERLSNTVSSFSQLDSHEEQLKSLGKEVKQNNQQLDVLVRHTKEGTATRLIERRLADLVGQLDGQQEQLEALSRSVKSFSQLDSHQQELKGLGKTLKKLTRTHFKANTLHESQQEQMDGALSTLRELVTQRDEVKAVSEEAEERQQRLKKTRQEARHEMAAELLPALDGVENAIESGRVLLERRQIALQEADAAIDAEIEAHNRADDSPQDTNPTNQKTREGNASFWSRLDYAFGGELPEKPEPKVIYKTVKVKVPAPSDEPFVAWLDGLELVRERFLSILRNEDITPILALDELFDPRLHIAVEAVERDDVPPGTVVDVIRKGYRQSGRILRYAEVVVSKRAEE